MVIRNRGHLFRLIGLHSMILIHMLIPLPQLQQLLEHLHPFRLQLPCIHQFLVVLPPGAHVAFLRDELGGFAVVSLQKVDGFLPFGEPEFVLGHISYWANFQRLSMGKYCRIICLYSSCVIGLGMFLFTSSTN